MSRVTWRDEKKKKKTDEFFISSSIFEFALDSPVRLRIKELPHALVMKLVYLP